jgi:Zn-finger nucleic acid-binding protein
MSNDGSRTEGTEHTGAAPCEACGGALAAGTDLPPCLCLLMPTDTLPSIALPEARGGTKDEARALRCPACGGWLEATTRRCTYCKAQLAAVRCWRCFELGFAGSSNCAGCGARLGLEGDLGTTMDSCPDCGAGEKLHLVDVGEHRIRECMRCGGVLLDHATLEHLTHAREVEAGLRAFETKSVSKSALTSTEVRYRPCASCGRLMTRRNFGGSSGVIVDVCKDHGIWFDAEELTAVLRFVATGGLRRQREEASAEARRELSRRRAEALAEQAKLQHSASTVPERDLFVVESAAALLSAIVEAFWRR